MSFVSIISLINAFLSIGYWMHQFYHHTRIQKVCHRSMRCTLVRLVLSCLFWLSVVSILSVIFYFFIRVTLVYETLYPKKFDDYIHAKAVWFGEACNQQSQQFICIHCNITKRPAVRDLYGELLSDTALQVLNEDAILSYWLGCDTGFSSLSPLNHTVVCRLAMSALASFSVQHRQSLLLSFVVVIFLFLISVLYYCGPCRSYRAARAQYELTIYNTPWINTDTAALVVDGMEIEGDTQPPLYSTLTPPQIIDDNQVEGCDFDPILRRRNNRMQVLKAREGPVSL